MPGLGARGDIFTTSYPSGCNNRAGSCGNVQVSIPKERRCPATDQDRTTELPESEYERVMRDDPRCAGTHSTMQRYGALSAGDPTALHNLFGVDDQAAAQALAQGKAVVFDPVYLKDGKVTLTLQEPYKSGPSTVIGADGTATEAGKPKTHEVSVDAVLTTAAVPGAAAFVSPQAAQQLGLKAAEAGSVWLPDAVPSGSAEQKAMAAVAKVDPNARLTVERGYRPQHGLVSLALTGFAALVALGAAGIATGLAAADSQRDLATLAAVGAGGGIRRRLSGFQCGVIAAMGAALGTVSGMVPAVALRKVEGMASPSHLYATAAQNQVVIAFPWLNIGLTLVALPTVAVLLAMLFTRSRLSLMRRSA